MGENEYPELTCGEDEHGEEAEAEAEEKPHLL